MATLVLGASGSIAAYKAADIASRLVKAGHTVYPVLTPGAAQFLGPATLRALTGRPCPVSLSEEPFAGEIAHIFLARSADLFLIAPASMNLLARLAHGLADDMLTAATLATRAPVLLAPAMNTGMWDNPATRANVAALERYGYQFVDPAAGRLACRDEGVGKLASVDDICDAVERLLAGASAAASDAWSGRSVLVTAGPTREPLDPVRYLTNRSSGRMGYAIAEAALARGARVTLVTGPVAIAPPPGSERLRVVAVTTAEEMRAAALSAFPAADVAFAAAAVADYRPSEYSAAKIKKAARGADTLTLGLTRNPDILAEMGRCKRPDQRLVGFAAETGASEEIDAHARVKLDAKQLDYVVANDVLQPGAGFDGNTNIVTVHERAGETHRWPLMSKRAAAERLLDLVAAGLTPPRSPAPRQP